MSLPSGLTHRGLTDMIRRRREDAANVTCTFQGIDGEEQNERSDALAPNAMDGSPAIGTRSGSIFGTAIGQDRIDLGQYVDQVCSAGDAVAGVICF